MFDKLVNGIGSAMTAVGLAEKTDATPQTAAPTVQPTAPTSVAPSVTNFPTAPSVDAERIAKYDATAKGLLQEALSCVQVKHITELQAFLSTLESAIPVEAVRFQTALKLFVSKGIPVSAIINEYDAYEGALQAKEQLFEKESKEQYENRVGAKVKSVEAFDKQIKATRDQIETLQTTLIGLTNNRQTEQAGISVEDAKLKTLQERFNLQYASVLGSVQQQKQKIVEFSKGL